MTTTLVDLKMKKTELRNKLEDERKARKGIMRLSTLQEYQNVVNRIKNAESQLLT